MNDRSMRRPLALLQFRGGEGEVTKLLLVDGRDQRVIIGREGGLFLSKIWVKVVDVFWCFDPGLEGWLHFSTIQLLPIYASEEVVAGHSAVATL